MKTSPRVSAPSTTRIAMASLMGTAIEFYDFYIYGTAAALVLNTAFFPGMDPVAGRLAAFSTFAVAFVSRPLGSAVFGHWGDRVGRKSMLVVSLLVMGLSTVAIGLLPGYAAIGVVGVLCMAAGTVVSAVVSDRLGRRRTLLTGTAVAVAWGLVMFPLMETGSVVLAGVALAGALGLMGLIFGPMGAYLPELFRTEFRYSGASVAYSLGGVLGGAVPPLVATSLQTSGLGVMGVGLYVSAMALLSLLCLLALPETGDISLR
ncbi:MFS transporter [Nonomuraea sp. NPDC049758]|uniref:MFS transporter n=1 Tax=Nonomuraea sp. NPDC049758 TaxID=3154360 RepID=UPI00343674C2